MTYRTKRELDALLFEHNLYVLMPDWEFDRWVQEYVNAGAECNWAGAANRIIGFTVTWSQACREHDYLKPSETTSSKPTSKSSREQTEKSTCPTVTPVPNTRKSTGTEWTESGTPGSFDTFVRKWPAPNEKHSIYNAKAAWPGAEIAGPAILPRLRAFLDECDVGDLTTPGAVGLRRMEVMMPPDERFWRPGWVAWQELHDHGVAGWVDMFMRHQGQEDERDVCLDMNSAYPTAARSGMPAGRCSRIWSEEDAAEEAWTFGEYKWRLSPDAELVERAKYIVLAIGRHDNDGSLVQWVPEPGAEGHGWYTGVEVEAARNSGAYSEFVLQRGWGWEKVSSAFFGWTEWIDAAKARYKALGPEYEIELGWVKRMSVAPFGRFFMDADVTKIYSVDSKEALEKYPYVQKRPIWVQNYGKHTVEFQTVSFPGGNHDPTKLPQLAIHVWTQTRVKLAETMQLAAEAGWEIYMCAIDGIYAKPVSRSQLELPYGLRMGQWKQKELFGVEISAPGTVKARLSGGQKYVKMPGIPRGDPRRR